MKTTLSFFLFVIIVAHIKGQEINAANPANPNGYNLVNISSLKFPPYMVDDENDKKVISKHHINYGYKLLGKYSCVVVGDQLIVYKYDPSGKVISNVDSVNSEFQSYNYFYKYDSLGLVASMKMTRSVMGTIQGTINTASYFFEKDKMLLLQVWNKGL